MLSALMGNIEGVGQGGGKGIKINDETKNENH